MKCPVDNEILLITHRDGVEIDYCPKCRGVWLDRGELDKLISKSEKQMTEVSSRNHNYNNKIKHNKTKKKSIFGEILDFDFFD